MRSMPGQFLLRVPGRSYSCQLRRGSSPTSSPPSSIFTDSQDIAAANSHNPSAAYPEARGLGATGEVSAIDLSLLVAERVPLPSGFPQGPSGVGSIRGGLNITTTIWVSKRAALLHKTPIITRLLRSCSSYTTNTALKKTQREDPQRGLLNNSAQANEMARWVKARSTNSEGPSLIPGIYVIIENQLPGVFSSY